MGTAAPAEALGSEGKGVGGGRGQEKVIQPDTPWHAGRSHRM